MITIEQLFKEDFKPAWMLLKEELVKQSMLDDVKVRADFEWRQNAYATLRRIALKYRKR